MVLKQFSHSNTASHYFREYVDNKYKLVWLQKTLINSQVKYAYIKIASQRYNMLQYKL